MDDRQQPESLKDILSRTWTPLSANGVSGNTTDQDTSAKSPPCPECEGMGWLSMPDGEFGSKALRCGCRAQEDAEFRQMTLRTWANVTGPLAAKTFASLLPRPDVPEWARMLDGAREYAAGRCPEKWLALMGARGAGKTHLALAVANERIAAGQVVRFDTAPNLLSELRSRFDAPRGEGKSADDLVRDYSQVSLLVLDDLGAEKQTDWAAEKLFMVLDYRYLHELETVITSNGLPTHMPPRLADRLMDKRMVLLCGGSIPSYRSGRTW